MTSALEVQDFSFYADENNFLIPHHDQNLSSSAHCVCVTFRSQKRMEQNMKISPLSKSQRINYVESHHGSK